MFAARRAFCTSSIRWAGHNKWSKIKNKKGINDANKSAVYTKAQKDILIAVRTGGGSIDPEKNGILATVLDRVRAAGVPKDNISKALAKASKGKSGGETYVYEAMAANNSVAMIIECASDNAKRTVQTLREILSDHDAHMAAVGFMFKQVGCVKATAKTEEEVSKLIDVASELQENLDFEYDQLEDEEAYLIELKCPPSSLLSFRDALSRSGLGEIISSEVIYAPLDVIDSPPDVVDKVRSLVEGLEANEDTLRVWTNLNIL